MTCNVHTNKPFSVTREGAGANVSAKTIDQGQPERPAQADLGRKFLPLVNFLHVKGPYFTII